MGKAGPAAAHPGKGAGHKPPSIATKAAVAKGQYQTADSERNDVLRAASAVGRPPVTQTALLKLDPRHPRGPRHLHPAGGRRDDRRP